MEIHRPCGTVLGWSNTGPPGQDFREGLPSLSCLRGRPLGEASVHELVSYWKHDHSCFLGACARPRSSPVKPLQVSRPPTHAHMLHQHPGPLMSRLSKSSSMMAGMRIEIEVAVAEPTPLPRFRVGVASSMVISACALCWRL